MPKQLFVALIGEGSTDEVVLSTIIRRTLEEVSRQHGFPFDVLEVTWIGGAKGNATVAKVFEAHEIGAQILFLHRDTDSNSDQFTIDNHIAPILEALTEEIRTEMIIVPLIIRHEQETWLLADIEALDEILGGKIDRQQLNLPPNIETRANTKELFHETLRIANAGRTRGRGFQPDAVAEQLAARVDLIHLAKLSSYQNFVAATEAALHSIGYLPA